jgi:hypothetical protein
MRNWNQIAWTVFWSLLCVVVAVPTVGTSFMPGFNLFGTIVGLALSFLFGFLACRAFERRAPGTKA